MPALHQKKYVCMNTFFCYMTATGIALWRNYHHYDMFTHWQFQYLHVARLWILNESETADEY